MWTIIGAAVGARLMMMMGKAFKGGRFIGLGLGLFAFALAVGGVISPFMDKAEAMAKIETSIEGGTLEDIERLEKVVNAFSFAIPFAAAFIAGVICITVAENET